MDIFPRDFIDLSAADSDNEDLREPFLHPPVELPPPEPAVAFAQVIEPVEVKEPEDERISTILEAFPDASPVFIRSSLRKFNPEESIERVCDQMLNQGYDKAPKPEPLAAPEDDSQAKTQRDYTTVTTTVSYAYSEATLEYLKNMFPRLSVTCIRNALSMRRNHLYPAMELLNRSMDSSAKGDVIALKFLKSARYMTENYVPACADPEFQAELDWIQTKDAVAQEEDDKKLAEKLNEEQYEEAGQLIDCGCCFVSYPFEQMCQCTDGHLFCVECLRRFAQERIFGENRVDLQCMATEEKCEAFFPRSQLQKALTKKMWRKYEDLEQEQAVSRADIEGLVECPFCSFKAVVDNPDDKVFHCLKCKRDSCRLCHEPSHIPLRCDEVESKNETSMRIHVEKKMTEALLRECPKCKTKFFKEEGCNKMRCSCGHVICYVCRQTIPNNVGYGHFCPHRTNMVEGFGRCTKPKCGKCYLWSRDSMKADAAAVEAQGKAAAEEYRADHGTAVDLKATPGGDMPPPKRHRHDPDYPAPADYDVVHGAMLERIIALQARRRGRGRGWRYYR